MYQYGLKGWGNMVIRDGWKYFILACCDVEGNFLVVKAYEYTNLLSCMLLDAWAIPVCFFVAWVWMRPNYRWSQIIGIMICVGGLGMLVASDQITDKDFPAVNKVKGDIFMLFGASLYGFTNATEEFFVRRSPLYEVVGQLGMWGVLINGIQASSLEHNGMKTANWDGKNIGLLFAYTAAMFILYTVAPLLYRMASSVYFNLSLLSSDFFGLLFGLFLYHYSPYWLYFIAFAVIIVGLIVYFWSSAPEEQGKLNPQKPSYVRSKKESNGGVETVV
jgi:solute carrier family 35 protein F1/2